MQIWQGNLINALRGIQNFLDNHADALGTIPKSGARQRLDAQVAEMDAHSVAQSSSHVDAQNATRMQNRLRQAVIRDRMTPIARVAAADLPPGPALDALKLPTRRLSTAQLRATALGMADSAEPHAAVFTAAGLPDDFVTQLRNVANDLLTPVDSGKQSRSIRSGATALLKSQSTSVRKTVRILDALVRTQLAADPDLLTRWNAVKRPATKPTGKSTAPAGTAPGSTATASTAPGSTATPSLAPEVPAAAA